LEKERRVISTVFFQDEDASFLRETLANVIQPDEKLREKKTKDIYEMYETARLS